MSVYAKTVMTTMPKSCAECKLGQKYGRVGDVKCLVLNTYFTGNVIPPHKDRPDECPLVTADADALEVERLREQVETDSQLRSALSNANALCRMYKTRLARVEAERDAAKRTLDGICSHIDNDGWLRKQFCENGNSDLEPCLCPSLREHSGYIDSDDCEGCEHFVNSWCAAVK